MSSTMNNPIWETISSVSYQLQEDEKAQKRGAARIAQTHHVNGKQKLARDVILPSAGDGLTESAKKGNRDKAKPSLPQPTTKFAGLKNDDGKEKGKTLGLISIIGEVMALQAKTNSNFWSTLWKQASQSMMIEVKFAPIIATAIKSSYTAQSLATKAQAKMSKEDGAVSLMMFGVGVGMGVYGGLTDDTPQENPTQPSTGTEDEKEEEGAGVGGPSTSNSTEQTTLEDTNEVTEATEKKNNGWWGRGTNTIKSLSEKVDHKQLGKLLNKGLQASMSMDVASRGITGFFIDCKYKAKQAVQEGIQGQAQALSKESEQYAQFYGQAFSRSENLREGMQQNIDFAMKIFESAADTITATVRGMFQG